MITDKIDVCINVFGKPYQTIVTLKSLLEHSGKHIDKIYFIEEFNQPEIKLDFDYIKTQVGYSNIEHFIPKQFLWVNGTDVNRLKTDKDYLQALRYQYGLENTNKKYLLLVHNDMLFFEDIVGAMLNKIQDNIGIGLIGQCWNCPFEKEHKCNGDIFPKYNPNINEVNEIVNKYLGTRTAIHRHKIDSVQPIPLPECRLNEFVCLINMEIYNKEVFPNGDIVPFGGHYIMDIADLWFRQFVLKGYTFKNMDIYKYCKHTPFNETQGGHQALFNKESFYTQEKKAEEWLLSKKYWLPLDYNSRTNIEYFDDTSFKDEYQDDVYAEASKIVQENGYSKILDIGTGSGYKLIKYFDKYYTFGVDIEPTLSYLNKTYPNKKWGNMETALKNEYDLIICSDVIEHILDPNTLLNTINSISYKKIVFSTPDRLSLYGYNHKGPPTNSAHVREWSEVEFNNYIKEQFKILKHFKSNIKSNTQILVGEKRKQL